MKELSVFIDESGDFGEYSYHSPYYIISMVFHDQNIKLEEPLNKLKNSLYNLSFQEDHCIHTGPIIRREKEYTNVSIEDRKRLLNSIISFINHIDIRYKCFYLEKKHITDTIEATIKLSKQISQFVNSRLSDFLSFDNVKIYYDNGQIEVTRILVSVFSSLLPNVIFRKVLPSDYRLFQVADLICTIELIRLKVEQSVVSASEIEFFGNMRDFKKNYLKPVLKKEWL